MTDSTDFRTRLSSQIADIARLHLSSTVGQTCSLNIEADGTLTLSTQHPDVSGTPLAIYHGLTRSITLPTGVDPDSLADFLTEHLDDLETLVNGMDTVWNGNNYVGTLSDEAAAIENQWQSLLNDEDGSGMLDAPLERIGKWEASDWLSPIRAEIAGQDTRAEATAFALDGHPEDGLVSDGSQRHYVDSGDVETVAGQWWDEAHEGDTEDAV